jgi:hypothetical protein
MKAYFDGGLKTLAKQSGYPLASLQTCGQFKRTHHFILEVWEAMYKAMLSKFIEFCDTDTEPGIDVPQIIRDTLDVSSGTFSESFNVSLMQINEVTTKFYDEFQQFINHMANSDSTWQYWVQFVFQDAMAYIALYLAIRGADWNLRVACIKLMAPVFTAFNHTTYQKLISQHISDILCMPPAIIAMFQQGAFVVNIRGNAWHSVGIDEAHEMLINKSSKTAIVKPNPDYISRVAHYLPHRTAALENLTSQLFPWTTNINKMSKIK